MNRVACVDTLAAAIAAIRSSHPLRVAIDGVVFLQRSELGGLWDLTIDLGRRGNIDLERPTLRFRDAANR